MKDFIQLNFLNLNLNSTLYTNEVIQADIHSSANVLIYTSRLIYT